MSAVATIEEDFCLEAFLPQQLAVTAGRVTRMLAAEIGEALGLSLAEWRVIVVVGQLGTATPGVVSKRAEMDKVKVSRASAMLVSRGLLQQTTDREDARARLLRLTRKGLRVYQDAVALGRRIEEQIGSGWDGLRRALVRLDSVLDVEEMAEEWLPTEA